MNKKTIKQILFIVFLSLTFYWAINNWDIVFTVAGNLIKVLFPIILGGAIAFIINIPMKWLETLVTKIAVRFKKSVSSSVKRGICLPLATVLVIGAIVAIMFVIIPQVLNMFVSFFNMLPGYIKSLEKYFDPIYNQLTSLGFAIPEFDLDPEKITSTFNFISKYAQAFLDNTVQITASFFSAIFNFFLAFTFAMYLLLEKENFTKWTKKAIFAFLPQKWATYTTSVMRRTNKAFSSFITGQLTEAVILGSLCFIGMKLLSFPESGLISVIVAFTALIPVFGAWIGAITGAFIVLLTAPIKALFFLAFIIILQQVEGNLIYPRVVGKSVGLPGVLVLASVTIGGNLLGVAGMLLSIPLCSVIYSIFKETVDYMYTKKVR